MNDKSKQSAWMVGRKDAEEGNPRQTDYSDPKLIEAYGSGYDSVDNDGS